MTEPIPTRSTFVKFGRRDGLFVAVCALMLAVSAWIAVRYWDKAFPEASIDFKVSRGQSEALASGFLGDHGFLPAGKSLPGHHAASFVHDDDQRVFLERTFGLETTNAMLGGRVRFWRWGHRWFTPLEKEEWRAEVTTTGEIVSCEHLLPEEAAGASLSEDEAKALATAFFKDKLGRKDADWQFLSAKATKRPHRTDYTFTWKSLGFAELEPLDSSYRARVTVTGDTIGGFNEWVEVPERWQRDYSALRAKNDTAGLVDALFFLLTALAILVVFFLQAGKRDVPWKLAALLGAVGGVLAFASALNALPQALYGFDTTATYSAFLVRQIMTAVLSGLGLAAVIFLLTAAGEPLYRRAYGQQVVLSSLFTARGLRTKTFFRSIVLGVALCGFFLAYQIVFYIVAGKFGAWAPMEVKYDDLLNTRFPWTTVLLIGFMPAITEEFMSRMFSIPFLTQWMKFRWVAIVVAAFIWGFGHATYPNQPFWIRGVEVGIAGVIVGFVMLRYGILATLVWHYTVDALYTGLVLLSSDSWYNRISASLAIGWTLIPLGACLVAYLRRGGFESEDGLRNADVAVAPVPSPPPKHAVPGEAEAPVPSAMTGYAPLSRAALGIALALVVAAVGAAIVFRSPLDELGRLPVTREQAIAAGEARLHELGADPSAFRRVAAVNSSFDPLDAKYVLSEKKSFDALAQLYKSKARPGAYWSVRFFRPEQKEEYTFAVGPEGTVLTEQHQVPDEDPGADLSEADARSRAETYLKHFGIDVAVGWELKESRAEKRPKRTDWTFEWEDADHVRRQVVVAGDTPSQSSTYLKLPEEFVRDREQVGAVKGLLLGVRVLAILLAVSAGIAVAVIQFRARLVRWRWVAVAGAVMALVFCGNIVNTYAAAARAYQTSMPWSLFVVGLSVTPLIGAAAVGLFGGLMVGIAASLYPEHVAPLRGHLRDALAGALAFEATIVLSRALHRWLDLSWIASALPAAVSSPDELNTYCATLALILPWLTTTVLGVCMLATLAHVQRRWLQPFWARAGALLLVALALLPKDARTAPEWMAGALFAVLVPGALWLVATKYWRGNALAFVFGVGIASGLGRCLALLEQPNDRARVAASVALVAMAVVLGAVAWRARTRPA